MKKLSVYFTALAVTLCVVYSSCKKTTHGTNPTPSNTRLLSYTKTTTSGLNALLSGYIPVGPSVIETYSFSYDKNNRVSKIIYTTNDTVAHRTNRENLIATFYYTGGTIIKITTTPVVTDTVEVDSFMENSAGLVTNAYTPTINNVYDYYGKLMIRNTIISHDTTGTATTVSVITSNSGNFLELTYNDELTFNFLKVQPTLSTVMAYYTYYSSTLAGLVPATSSGAINSSSKVVNGYSREPVFVMAVDTLHDTAYASYPGGIWPKEDYTFTGNYNRIGDYFQLQSFTTYGTNIYQNANLVKSITNSGYTTNVSYVIDAQSEITQTNVGVTDSLGASWSHVYSLQYDSY